MPAPAAAAQEGRPRTRVVFHRDFKRFQGGHLKVFHYFEHTRSSPAHQALIRFSPGSRWDATNPWHAYPDSVLAPDEPDCADVRFLAGMDWLSLEPAERASSPVPIVNLIQGFRHARPRDAASEFLRCRAVRICVSPQIEQALRDLGGVRGPLLTIPIALDLERLPRTLPDEERDIDCVVLAIKDPERGRAIARRLERRHAHVALVERPLPRARLLELFSRARVSVHLPAIVEGAYLPALECMALRTLVVCPDCVGNRSFCRDSDTCLVPARSERALYAAAASLLDAGHVERARMLDAGQRESAGRSLAIERKRYLSVLGALDQLWQDG